MRFRLGIEGKLWKIIPIKWTLIAQELKPSDAAIAGWFCELFDGKVVNSGILSGRIFVTLTEEQ